MIPPEWSASEHLLLFNAYLTEIDWERRAARVAKEFGSRRSKNFFNSRSCKLEFDRLMSEPVPGNVTLSTGVSYSHRNVIESWISYCEQEIKREKSMEMELELVEIRRKMDLIERVHNGLLSEAELLDLLEIARKEDEKRDPVEVQRTVGAYMARLEEIDRLGLRQNKDMQSSRKRHIPATKQSLHSPRGCDSAFRSPSPIRMTSPIKSPIRPLVDAIREANAPAAVPTPPVEVEEENVSIEKEKEEKQETEMIEEQEEGVEMKDEEEGMEVDKPTTPVPVVDELPPPSTDGSSRRRGKGRPPKEKMVPFAPTVSTPSTTPLSFAHHTSTTVEGDAPSSEGRTRRSSLRKEEDTKKDVPTMDSPVTALPGRRASIRRGTATTSSDSPLPASSSSSQRESRRSKTVSRAGSEPDGVKEETISRTPSEVGANPPTSTTPTTTMSSTTSTPALAPPPSPKRPTPTLPSPQATVSPRVAPVTATVTMTEAKEEPKGPISMETQTEISIRSPLQSSGTVPTRKTSQARRSTRAHTSTSSTKDTVGGHKEVHTQTTRVEFGEKDELIVYRSPAQRLVKRNLVTVQPIESMDGYGSDDEVLSSLKRRIKVETTDTPTDSPAPAVSSASSSASRNGSRQHTVTIQLKEDTVDVKDDDGSVSPPKKVKKEEEPKMSKEELIIVKNSLISFWHQVHNHKFSSIFKHAVTERDAPGYSTIVRKPMDLWSLKMEIEKGKVLSVEKMKNRLMLMFANAVMFNSTAHDVNNSAKEMAAETVEIFRRLDDGKGKQLHPISKRSAKVNAEEHFTHSHSHHSGRRDQKGDGLGQRIFEMPLLGLHREVRVRLQGEDEFPKLFPDMSFFH